MKVIRVNETSQLDPTLSTESVKYDRTFVFFFGAEMEETSESWCPDCVIADPRVRKHLLKVPNSLVIEAPCKKSEYSRNPSFAYRLHPHFAIKVIPSLFEWSAKEGKVVKSLIDEDCSDEARLEEFIR